jgi:hypothetical protein
MRLDEIRLVCLVLFSQDLPLLPLFKFNMNRGAVWYETRTTRPFGDRS